MAEMVVILCGLVASNRGNACDSHSYSQGNIAFQDISRTKLLFSRNNAGNLTGVSIYFSH